MKAHSRRIRRSISAVLSQQLLLHGLSSAVHLNARSALESERHLTVHPIAGDLAALDDGLKLLDLDGADVAKSLSRPGHHLAGGILPALLEFRINSTTLMTAMVPSRHTPSCKRRQLS
jgi:hypothetical protein